MDKKKSLLNVSVSVGFKIITMIMSIVVRRLLINTCGNEVNGLNSLYLSIISTLSVVELGVGNAISFCMYKPIVEGNKEQVSALYRLFQRMYLIIGGAIFLMGLALTPFLHHLAKDYAALNVNLYSTFVLMLISVVIAYFFASKTSLINAYKNNYITTAISSGGIVLQYVLQIVVLLLTGSFVLYLICRIAAVIVQWSITESVARKKHHPILCEKGTLDDDTKKTLMRSIKAMFMHKIGYELVSTTDSLIISAFIGVAVLGTYTNYTSILASMNGIIRLFFASLTSIIGHLYVKGEKENALKTCDSFHILNFFLGLVFYLGYYAVIDDLIAILFSVDLVCERAVAFVVTLNGFVQFMRTSTLTFRDATGTFYHDRWKPFIEGTLNLVLSILLVKWIGVTGVIVATVLTNLLICHIIEPFVLYKHAFGVSPAKYYGRNYGFVMLFIIGMLLLDRLKMVEEYSIVRMLKNGSISIGLSALICGGLLVCMRKETSFLKSLLVKEGGKDV